MASENKKRKLMNSHMVKSGLKSKLKLKGLAFYNSALRQQLKKIAFKAESVLN